MPVPDPSWAWRSGLHAQDLDADGHLPAADVTYDNASSGLTADDVQAAIDELATGAGLDALNAAVFGYQAHGNLGSTETFDSTAAGWHSGTLNADCTFTFTAQASGTVSSMVLELTQDGTGGWALTLPGSVVGDFSGYDSTAGTTSLLMFFSRDGGTTWFGFIAGGSGTAVAALDDLTDVDTSGEAAGDRLRFDGTTWKPSPMFMHNLTAFDGTNWSVLFDGAGNCLYAEG